jgi:outer membrane lipoprotein-sorting protein
MSLRATECIECIESPHAPVWALRRWSYVIIAVMSVQYRAPVAITLVIVAAVTLGVAAQRSPSAARDSFDERYRRGQQANAGIKTLTAEFTEVTTSSLLTRPLVSRGTIAVERPSRIVLRYRDPERRVVLIDGNQMTMTWPSRNIRQVSDIRRSQERVQRYFVNGSADELRREFDIELSAVSERPGTDEVRLRPRRRQIRETLSRLDLWVDPSTSLLAAMRMVFANGDTKTMTLANVATNPILGSDAFSVAD